MLEHIPGIASVVTKLCQLKSQRQERQSLAPQFSVERHVVPRGDYRIPSRRTKMTDEGFFIIRFRVISAPNNWVLSSIDAGASAQIADKITDQSGRWIGDNCRGTVSYGPKECAYLIKAGSHDVFDLLVKVAIADKATIRLKLEGADGTERELKVSCDRIKWMKTEALQ